MNNWIMATQTSDFAACTGIHSGKETKYSKWHTHTGEGTLRTGYAKSARSLRREFNFHLLKDDDVSILCVETHSRTPMSAVILHFQTRRFSYSIIRLPDAGSIATRRDATRRGAAEEERAGMRISGGEQNSTIVSLRGIALATTTFPW